MLSNQGKDVLEYDFDRTKEQTNFNFKINELSSKKLAKVYQHLRALGAKMIGKEYRYSTMQSESLIHDAYLRVVELNNLEWRDSDHFFSVWAGVMKRVIIDNARAMKTYKRGGQIEKIPLHESIPEKSFVEEFELYAALDKLRKTEKEVYEVVVLRYFSGFTIDEVAQDLAISTATVKRRWVFARTWLYAELH